ncbi:hypothetical protein F5X96DRAFT_668887 [Biscogniauxia mediterranea]|nr:hypothetical protein F5X96DRAFT_668887 [Biscogniauxia mediterranea]
MPPPPPEESKHRPKPSEGHDIVTIAIPTGERYVAHTHLLVGYSKYFHGALRNGMEEAKTRQFDLVEHAMADTVSFFIDWLYKQDDERSSIIKWVRSKSLSPELSIKIWLFADYIQAPHLQNDMISSLSSHYNSNKPNFGHRLKELTRWNPPPASGLRRLIVKEIARGLSSKNVASNTLEEWIRMLDMETLGTVVQILVKRHVNLDRENDRGGLDDASMEYFEWSSPADRYFFEKTD